MIIQDPLKFSGIFMNMASNLSTCQCVWKGQVILCLTKHHAVQECGREALLHANLTSTLDGGGGQFHGPAPLYLVPTECKSVCVPEPVMALRREKLSPAGNQNLIP